MGLFFDVWFMVVGGSSRCIGCLMRDVTDVCRSGGGKCPWCGPHVFGLSPNMLLSWS